MSIAYDSSVYRLGPRVPSAEDLGCLQLTNEYLKKRIRDMSESEEYGYFYNWGADTV